MVHNLLSFARERPGIFRHGILLQIASMLEEDGNLNNTHSGRFAIIAGVLIVMASILGLRTAGDNIIAADVRIERWIQQWQGNLPEVLERIGDMSGETRTAIAAILGGMAIAAFLRVRQLTIFFILVGAFRIVGMGLKPMFESPRPIASTVRITDYSDGFGYPSGHSMTAAMIATVVVVLIWHTPAATRTRWAITAGAVLFALLVGWSRIWSGAHWPTDVIGGGSYGVALVLVAWAVSFRTARSQID